MALARVLFSQYLLPFEATSVLLVVAIVGVMVLTRRMGTRSRASAVPDERRAEPSTREEAAMSVDPGYYLALAGLMFTIGVVGALVRRNAIVIFMFIELMLNAVNLVFVTFARMHGNLDGQVLVFFVLVVAAAEVVVGLGDHHRRSSGRRQSANVDDVNLLKW